MVVQLEIVSKEMIKPSSPTPHHLRDLNFSFLDATTVSVYTPFILFYHANTTHDHIDEISQQLKQSLSDTLTLFYPLAGRINGNLSINCNDDGAEFIEARVHARLSDFIDDPNVEELKQLLPIQPLSENDNIVLSLQANFFDCGGIAIGVCMSHKVGDGASQVEFIKAWAATCRRDTEMIVQPRFDMASHFPLGDSRNIHPPPLVEHDEAGKVVTKRLILNKEKLIELKSEIASAPDSEVKDPTRVEAASALIWKHIIDITPEKVKVPSVALHAVNIRSRMIPPLDEQTFGNCVMLSAKVVLFKENDFKEKQELHHLAYRLRKGIREIDGDYINEVQADAKRCYTEMNQSLGQVLKDGVKLCTFTSWCRFPVYKADYGWGKPVWVCTTPMSIKNMVIFMSTPCGEGIEAWVNLLEDDMKVFGIQ